MAGSNQTFQVSDSEDSVDAQFAGDVSEDTLEVLRSFQRPFIDREDKDAPDEDPYMWALQQPDPTALPPGAYEDARAFLEAKLNGLKQLRDKGLDPDHRQLVDYKRSLVEGKSQEEVMWLKLKAYQRALDQLNSQRQRQQDTEAVGAPSAASTSLAVLRQQQAEHDADTVAYTAYSEESEWAPDWQHVSYLPSTGPFTAQRTLPRSRAPVVSGTEPRLLTQVIPASKASSANQAAEQLDSDRYNPLYLEEARLRKELAQQRAARRNAFVLSFGTVVGLSLLRWWRQQRKGKKPTTPGRGIVTA